MHAPPPKLDEFLDDLIGGKTFLQKSSPSKIGKKPKNLLTKSITTKDLNKPQVV